MRRERVALLAVAVAILSLSAAAAYAATIEVVARGTIASREDKVDLVRGVARLVDEPADAAVQQRSAGRGPTWHMHAGPVIVIVKSGAFTVVDDDCSEKT